MATLPPRTYEEEQAIRYLVAIYNSQNMNSDRPTRPITLQPDMVTQFNVSAYAPTSAPQLASYYGHLEYKYYFWSTQLDKVNLETKTGESKFRILKEDWIKIQDLLAQGAQSGVQMPSVTATPTPGPMRDPRPELRLIEVPAMIGVNFDEFGSDVIHYAFDCECNRKARIFCRHISDAFLDARDHAYWDPRFWSISGLGAKFTIQIPIFNSVFYYVMLQKQSIATWDGEQVTKIFVKPMRELLPERFVDTTYTSILGDIRTEVLKHLDNMTDSLPSQCKSQYHNYGTNITLIDWLNSGSGSIGPFANVSRERRKIATTFTQHMYGLCYICYENCNPMFSLLNTL